MVEHSFISQMEVFRMDKFQLVSEYQPTGDQPAAISQLVEGLKAGMHEQTLLGVTGSGKPLQWRMSSHKSTNPP